MQKRSRRAQGIGTKKISVSVTAEDLKVLVARAKSTHRGNVSAVLHEMVEALRRQEALDRLITRLGGDEVTEAQVDALRNEILGVSPRAKRRSAA